jgi:hypothetical protein
MTTIYLTGYNNGYREGTNDGIDKGLKMAIIAVTSISGQPPPKSDDFLLKEH